jgi:hypothetical protein
VTLFWPTSAANCSFFSLFFMKTLLYSLLSSLLLVVTAQAQFPVPIPTIVEGPVKGISRNPDGSLLLTVMGVPVIVNSSTRVHSPSSFLTFAQLLNNTKLPGRLQRGFLNGTAIATGTQDAKGVMTAVNVSLTPAENVVVGMITKNSGGVLEMNQMPVKFCNDARMPGRGAMNSFAIPIDLPSVIVGTTASLEGYYDDASAFQSINLYLDTFAPPLSKAPQVSFMVLRATEQIGKGDTVEALGGVTFFHAGAASTQTINLYRVDGKTVSLIGSGVATRDNVFTDYGLFRIKVTTAVSSDPVLSKAPSILRAVNISPGAAMATTEDLVDIR